MQELKLIALDADDLAVVSAHLQDAVIRLGDMAFQRAHKRFACVLNRFDWVGAIKNATHNESGTPSGDTLQRRRSGLRFERVTGVRVKGIEQSATDTVLSLLALSFTPDDGSGPGGVMTLQFSGNATIELDVECIEIELKDLGAAWAARARPEHPGADQD